MKIRQMRPTVEEIRDDHVARYRYAAKFAQEVGVSRHVWDVGCGCGYGAYILASEGGRSVMACERDPSVTAYAEEHYTYPGLSFKTADFTQMDPSHLVDVLVMFEVVEHSDQAPAFLARASRRVPYLVGSVPNENVVPFKGGRAINPEHYRHYTAQEIEEELRRCGWGLIEIGSQAGKKGADAAINTKSTKGRTLVFRARSLLK